MSNNLKSYVLTAALVVTSQAFANSSFESRIEYVAQEAHTAVQCKLGIAQSRALRPKFLEAVACIEKLEENCNRFDEKIADGMNKSEAWGAEFGHCQAYDLECLCENIPVRKMAHLNVR